MIDGLSLAIAPGTFFTLLGPSGCGKTTLLRAVAGFVGVDAGRLRFGDTDVTRLPAHKRNIGMVFQDYALFPDKSVFDNIAYGLRARRQSEADIKRKVGEALERVGLAAFAARYPAELSGGQRQRVALVCALVIGPDVLLMDEPLSNLDAKLRHQVRDTIVTLQREAHTTTIFVTHDQDEALAMSDRIGVMNAGRLEQVARCHGTQPWSLGYRAGKTRRAAGGRRMSRCRAKVLGNKTLASSGGNSSSPRRAMRCVLTAGRCCASTAPGKATMRTLSATLWALPSTPTQPWCWRHDYATALDLVLDLACAAGAAGSVFALSSRQHFLCQPWQQKRRQRLVHPRNRPALRARNPEHATARRYRDACRFAHWRAARLPHGAL